MDRISPRAAVLGILGLMILVCILWAAGSEPPRDAPESREDLPSGHGPVEAPPCDLQDLPFTVSPFAPGNDSGPTSGLEPNEMGSVTILMYHHIGGEEGPWQRSLENFRRDLEYLWENGYRPVTLESYLSGTIDLPRGMSPVILTFDDGLRSHLAWQDGIVGRPEPDTAVGMLLEFSARHQGFDPHAVFYLNSPRPFHPMPQEQIGDTLRWLVDHGFELGNHTHYHANLGQLEDDEVQRVIALTESMITESVPGYRSLSLALPYGVLPKNRDLAVQGQYDGVEYEHEAVLLVGAEPAPSPYSDRFRPERLPRVQATSEEIEKWFGEMDRRPSLRYVSDGNPRIVTVPEALEHQVDQSAVDAYLLRILPGE